MIRQEAYYFAPQGQTKIMNEGWATYWHSRMMTRYHLRDDVLADGRPCRLARFLAERKENPAFSYRVQQDPVRGWVICWKEYTEDGRIRGYGQFYERPYAWLDD